MTSEEVLDVLAQYQETLGWLANDGRQQLADARLSVFRSDEHFAVFTEFPHFSYSANEFHDWLGCAGDCLISGVYETQWPPSLLLTEVQNIPLWDDPDCPCEWLADRSNFSVCVAGQRFDFAPSPQDYERARIIFSDERNGPNTINPAQLLRFVSVSLDHPFFRTEDELRALVQPQFSPQMSLLLQTSWWQHPEPLVSDDDPIFESQWIENIPCWQILARAIVSGDLDEWRAQDTSRFNTDWNSLERIYREGNFGCGFD